MMIFDAISICFSGASPSQLPAVNSAGISRLAAGLHVLHRKQWGGSAYRARSCPIFSKITYIHCLRISKTVRIDDVLLVHVNSRRPFDAAKPVDSLNVIGVSPERVENLVRADR